MKETKTTDVYHCDLCEVAIAKPIPEIEVCEYEDEEDEE